MVKESDMSEEMKTDVRSNKPVVNKVLGVEILYIFSTKYLCGQVQLIYFETCFVFVSLRLWMFVQVHAKDIPIIMRALLK